MALLGKDLFRKVREEKKRGVAAGGYRNTSETGWPKPLGREASNGDSADRSEKESLNILGQAHSSGAQLVPVPSAAEDLEKALTARDVQTLAGRIRVLEDITGAWACGNGATVWDAALVLIQFLETQTVFPGARVLELGSGTGLVGMFAAKMGAKVTVTERGLALPLLERNLTENELDKTSVLVKELDWTSKPFPAWLTEQPYDVVLGSDLVFPTNSECHAALIDILHALIGPETKCWIGHEPREPEVDEAFWSAAAERLNVRRLDAEELPHGTPSDVHVYELSALGSA
eukprot:TRINITY_DN93201_c0_g1_i1.p1 TRINITY_DN93201_c0_g1~~TRINITY_DN93201_c0_g1_i1.p1  ORF type:complete len:289 (-),score=37.64 TRINITY_DN93201_c0_g1_i1:770-1636(-)